MKYKSFMVALLVCGLLSPLALAETAKGSGKKKIPSEIITGQITKHWNPNLSTTISTVKLPEFQNGECDCRTDAQIALLCISDSEWIASETSASYGGENPMGIYGRVTSVARDIGDQHRVIARATCSGYLGLDETQTGNQCATDNDCKDYCATLGQPNNFAEFESRLNARIENFRESCNDAGGTFSSRPGLVTQDVPPQPVIYDNAGYCNPQ